MRAKKLCLFDCGFSLCLCMSDNIDAIFLGTQIRPASLGGPKAISSLPFRERPTARVQRFVAREEHRLYLARNRC